MSLIQDRDIFNIVASEYLDTKDLINLDSAIVEQVERAHFLELLETVPYKPPFHNNLEKWWINYKHCLAFLSARKMYCPEGAAWHVNKRAWVSLIDDITYDYKPLISKLKHIFFEGFGAPFDLHGLEICNSLERLHLCNYHLPERAKVLPKCPVLHELILQNTRISDDTLYNFQAMPALTHLTLRHCLYEALSNETLLHYMSTIQTIHVLNRVDEFFTCFCTPKSTVTLLTDNAEVSPPASVTNNIEVAYFDLLHTTQNNEFSFEPFLSVSPHLRELHIMRACIDVQTLFTQLARYCPQLEFLHLNHVRMATSGSSVGKTFDGEISFSRLQISTLLPPLDDNYAQILRLTRHKLQSLHISFAERLTEGGWLTVREWCPHLQTLVYEEKQEILETNFSSVGSIDNAGATSTENTSNKHRLASLFPEIVNLRVVQWKVWVAEDLKMKRKNESKIVYEQGVF